MATCPWCRRHIRRQLQVQKGGGKGEACVCTACGRVGVVEPDGSIRRATSKEETEVTTQMLHRYLTENPGL